MYVFLSCTIQVGDSFITVQLHWKQSFVFSNEYKERISQKVRKFAMLSLPFSPQYDFSVNGDSLQIWKVAADSWQGGRPQVWGLGKWLGIPLKMQHVTKCYADHGLEWIFWDNPCNRKYMWDLKHKKNRIWGYKPDVIWLRIWCSLVDTVMTSWVPENVGNCLISWEPSSFSWRTLLHRVH
jgi:hypothetical protein